jgi:hypothetical protein
VPSRAGLQHDLALTPKAKAYTICLETSTTAEPSKRQPALGKSGLHDNGRSSGNGGTAIMTTGNSRKYWLSQTLWFQDSYITSGRIPYIALKHPEFEVCTLWRSSMHGLVELSGWTLIQLWIYDTEPRDRLCIYTPQFRFVTTSQGYSLPHHVYSQQHKAFASPAPPSSMRR